MKIIVYTSVAPNSLDRFPLKMVEFDGWQIENRPHTVTPQQGLTDWMLGCWQQVIAEQQDIADEIPFKSERMDTAEFILIFKHNDFEVTDEINFLSQITGLIKHGTADLIGVAGTRSFDPTQRKPSGSYMRWTEFEPTNEKAGLIKHELNGIDYQTFYGVPGRVKIIDGCCMVCSGRLAPQIENLLTPKFHRDWYDIAFSWNVHQAGFSVYVINSLVKHESAGEYGLNWLKEGHEFFAHYGQYQPPESQERGHKDRPPEVGESDPEPAGVPGGAIATD